MAMIPGRTTCDVCGLDIEHGQLFCKVPVLIPRAIRQELVDAIEKEHKDKTVQIPSNPFGFTMSAEQMVVREWTCEVCYGCLFGLLPQLLEAIRKQIPEALANRRAAQERHRQSQHEFDVDAVSE